MADERIPLEDTFGDILRKAMRGTGISTAQLARRDRRIADAIDREWLKDDGTANDAQARALATVLRLDGGEARR